MRMSIEFEVNSSHMPKDYRPIFISLIKKVVENENVWLFNSYYKKHTLKPFTFSVFFPELKSFNNDFFDIGQKIRLDISTSSIELATYIYNGFLKLENYSFFENAVMLRRKIFLHKDVKIRKEDVLFRTIAPVLINNKGSSEKYLLPGENGFLEGLNFAIGETCKKFINKEKIEVEFTPIQWKRKVVFHYHQKRPGFVGMFKLKSTPDVLQLIYDIGLGVRRSQGFGMLEVIPE